MGSEAGTGAGRARSAFLWSYLALLLGGGAYLAWCWWTFSGPYRWLARTEMSLFGAYDGMLTGLVLLFVLLLPALLLGRLAERRGVVLPGVRPMARRPKEGPAALPADPVRTHRTTMLVTGGMAAACLLAAAVLGGLAWQRANRDPSVARIDLARPPAALPEADLYEVSGVVRPDLAVQWSETVRSHVTRRLFLPLVAPDWKPGDPIRVVLRVGMVGDAVVLYDDRRQAMVRLDRPQPYTTRPATVLGGPGSILEAPLPGAVADRWTSRGQPVASDATVLDESPGAASEAYVLPAAVAGVLGFFLLVAAALSGWQWRRRSRR